MYTYINANSKEEALQAIDKLKHNGYLFINEDSFDVIKTSDEWIHNNGYLPLFDFYTSPRVGTLKIKEHGQVTDFDDNDIISVELCKLRKRILRETSRLGQEEIKNFDLKEVIDELARKIQVFNNSIAYKEITSIEDLRLFLSMAYQLGYDWPHESNIMTFEDILEFLKDEEISFPFVITITTRPQVGRFWENSYSKITEHQEECKIDEVYTYSNFLRLLTVYPANLYSELSFFSKLIDLLSRLDFMCVYPDLSDAEQASRRPSVYRYISPVELYVIDQEETNAYADGRRKIDGGGYSQPLYTLKFCRGTGELNILNMGLFGTRFTLQLNIGEGRFVYATDSIADKKPSINCEGIKDMEYLSKVLSEISVRFNIGFRETNEFGETYEQIQERYEKQKSITRSSSFGDLAKRL